jgi:C4-dicarboxylate transporter, DctM subunit
MSIETTIGILGIVVLFALLASKIYIGVIMGLIGCAGFAYLVDPTAALSILGSSPYDTAAAYSFSVVPLFILMGQIAQYSGMSEDIYDVVYKWMGHFRGGLAMATVLGCAGFAAISGASFAAVAVLGAVALPEMRKYNYDLGLATGCITSGGTLGILIPPSIAFVVYGMLVEESIGKLLMAGIIPGILLTILYVLAIYIVCTIWPEMGPATPIKFSMNDRIKSLKGIWSILILFGLVIGGIYTGVFTPTEAAGVGAFGTMVIGFARRKLTIKHLIKAIQETMVTTAMVFLILVGANIFSVFLGVTELPMNLADYIGGLDVPRIFILMGILFLYIVLGCVLVGLAMIILTIPVIYPVISALGYDPIWFGVVMVIVLEIGLITPPVGLNVFVMKGVAPDVPLQTIFRGVVPFIIASVVALVLIIIFPEIATFLPDQMSK